MTITLTGPNDFAIGRALQTLIADFVTAHGPHSVESIDGDQFDPRDLPTLLTGVTLFAPERLAVLRDAAANKSLWETLGEWIARVPDGVTLVVIQSECDKRTRTYKELKKASDFREFPLLSEPELAAWLQEIAKELGGQIEAASARYLVARVGVNQSQLWHEMQKLVNYDAQVTRATIDLLVEPTPQASAFDLLDCALAGKLPETQTLLAKVRTAEDPYRLFGLFVAQVHALALVAQAGSVPADEVARAAGLHPFVVRKTQALARGLSGQRMQMIIETVARLDDHLKSGGEPWALVEQGLCQIAARA